MKKSTIDTVCMSVIVGILFFITGCTNTNPASTGTDSAYSVPDFKEKIRLELRIDNEPAEIDSAFVKIDHNFYLTGYSPRIHSGPYAYSHFVTLHAFNFKGVGTYTLDDGGEGTFLWHYATNDRDKNQEAIMTITKWEAGELAGSFSFTVIDGFKKRKRVEGRFYK